VDGVDLTETQAIAEAVAVEWGLELAPPFALSRFSYVAPVGDDAVLKVAWSGDEESLHESEALALWGGDAAVRLLRADKSRRALLEERAVPGDDISELPEHEATAIAVELAATLWRPAGEPFRWVGDYVPGWLDDGPGELTPLARELYASLDPGRDWLVHGDFHHHNILRHGDRFVAIDPKPYLADREYDVYTWLHNPLPYVMDKETTEQRIAAFVAAGLDDYRIRAWAIVRGAYLAGEGVEAEVLGGLLD
jgi:streptomycin 6-kinase